MHGLHAKITPRVEQYEDSDDSGDAASPACTGKQCVDADERSEQLRRLLMARCARAEDAFNEPSLQVDPEWQKRQLGTSWSSSECISAQFMTPRMTPRRTPRMTPRQLSQDSPRSSAISSSLVLGQNQQETNEQAGTFQQSYAAGYQRSDPSTWGPGFLSSRQRQLPLSNNRETAVHGTSLPFSLQDLPYGSGGQPGMESSGIQFSCESGWQTNRAYRPGAATPRSSLPYSSQMVQGAERAPMSGEALLMSPSNHAGKRRMSWETRKPAGLAVQIPDSEDILGMVQQLGISDEPEEASETRVVQQTRALQQPSHPMPLDPYYARH